MLKYRSPLNSLGSALLAIAFIVCSGSQALTQDGLNTLEIADAAKDHIKEKSRQNGGSFPLKDIPQGRKLDLKFNKIHKSKIGTVNENEYFVCANFTGENGSIYDVDIFLRKTREGNYQPSGKKPKVRKEDGDPRYTWEKEDKHYVQANKGLKRKKIHPDKENVQSSQPTRSTKNRGSNKPNFNNRKNNRGNEKPGIQPNNNMPGNNTPGNQMPNNQQPGGNMPNNNMPNNNSPGNNMPNNNNPGNNMPNNNTPGNNMPNNNTPNNNRPNNNRGPN